MKHFNSCIWHRELGIGWEPIGECHLGPRRSWPEPLETQPKIHTHPIAPLAGAGLLRPVAELHSVSPGRLRLRLVSNRRCQYNIVIFAVFIGVAAAFAAVVVIVLGVVDDAVIATNTQHVRSASVEFKPPPSRYPTYFTCRRAGQLGRQSRYPAAATGQPSVSSTNGHQGATGQINKDPNISRFDLLAHGGCCRLVGSLASPSEPRTGRCGSAAPLVTHSHRVGPECGHGISSICRKATPIPFFCPLHRGHPSAILSDPRPRV